MKSLLARKSILSIVIISAILMSFGIGVYAESALKKVTAYQNSNIKIKVNGNLVDMSSEGDDMYPLVYDNHSYVSAKALAEAMGGTVKWNNNSQTVEVITGESIIDPIDPSAGIPSKDNSETSNQNEAGGVSSSGVIKLSSDFNKDIELEKYKGVALEFAKAYASDAVEGENNKVKTLINKYVVDGNFDAAVIGKDESNESMSERIIYLHTNNDLATLKKWQKQISGLTLSDVVGHKVDKYDYYASIQYKITIPGSEDWGGNEPYISLQYAEVDGSYYLDNIKPY